MILQRSSVVVPAGSPLQISRIQAEKREGFSLLQVARHGLIVRETIRTRGRPGSAPLPYGQRIKLCRRQHAIIVAGDRQTDVHVGSEVKHDRARRNGRPVDAVARDEAAQLITAANEPHPRGRSFRGENADTGR